LGDVNDMSLDEARFNLATHIMSNGVELIIASDRVKHSDTHKLSHLYQKFNSVPSSRHIQEAKKPVTFAASTLLNHMILALPTAKQVIIVKCTQRKKHIYIYIRTYNLWTDSVTHHAVGQTA